MKILLLEESRGFRDTLHDALQKAGHEPALCHDSGAFIEAALSVGYDCAVIDVRSWFRGEALYSYMNILEKMDPIPMLFHHTPEGFKTLDGREPVAEDIVLEGSCSVDDIVQAL
ncbi:response regulator [Chitinivibrio alkaliphilus]|uniref:Response regulatory domain-containing protein n=1 Tax=Chitinivibrio alkaliphilus ACht1 TaxID=1313304 RepID=U7D7V7_9BACT|nr:response regulator [Chitinivibrio alkaliphilus]ERP31656.1 hypothetical protein CALK_1520 [Chitinivibrio alkaliphilus ACht1]